MASICKYFNVENESAHRAMGDCEALKKIFKPLLTIFKQKFGRKDIEYVKNKIANPYIIT